MELTGEYQIPAPPEKVWAALNDPDVLAQCIPGCEELTKDSETAFSAKVLAKVGPVKTRFSGGVTLSDLEPPRSYIISGEGKGGAAGFAKGSAKVTLDPDGSGTKLSYVADAQVGGKLAQLGSRLVAGTAKKYSEEFFDKFVEIVGDGAAAPAEAPSAAAEAEAPSEAAAKPSAGLGPWVWVSGVVAIIILVLLIFGT